MPLRNLVVIAFFGIAAVICQGKTPGNRRARELSRAMDIIAANHLEKVDRAKLFDDAMNGMAAGLDQYYGFISESQYKQVEETLDQEFGGIGIIVELGRETQRLTVLSPLVGTPAYEAGIRAGDTILEIDGVTTERMNLKQSVKLMRGKPGVAVELSLKRAGQEDPVKLSVKRAIIPIESVLGDRRDSEGAWVFRLEDEPEIAYIRLVTFGKQTVSELKSALGGSYKGLILDIRGNAGGLLSSAVGTCQLFVEEGKRIVSTRGRGGDERSVFNAENGPIVPADVPVVVLVNKYSASASEIVAACLQDHKRAVIVGERTWGKGTVQNIIELQGGRSALKLTTASYWRPSDKNIHRSQTAKESDDWGVQPNDGFKVEIPEKDIEKVLKWRRYRDVVRTPDQQAPAQPPEPAQDPQINAGISYLKSQASK